jgi:hypothetical protein
MGTSRSRMPIDGVGIAERGTFTVCAHGFEVQINCNGSSIPPLSIILTRRESSALYKDYPSNLFSFPLNPRFLCGLIVGAGQAVKRNRRDRESRVIRPVPSWPYWTEMRVRSVVRLQNGEPLTSAECLVWRGEHRRQIDDRREGVWGPLGTSHPVIGTPGYNPFFPYPEAG